MESTLQAHPLINGVLAYGDNRVKTSLLVEAISPPRTDKERSQLLLEIWPYIERANRDAPTYAKVDQDLVLFTEIDTPMVRAGKGTVLRKKTADLYQRDLEKAYENYTSKDTPLSRRKAAIA